MKRFTSDFTGCPKYNDKSKLKEKCKIQNRIFFEVLQGKGVIIWMIWILGKNSQVLYYTRGTCDQASTD